jgi:dynein heavy chain, axonemal
MESLEEAKSFNQKESLFEKDPTDYTKIHLILKDFNPYFQMWTIADNWYTNNESWLSTPWREVDAVGISVFIEESYRNLQQVVKFMREREIMMMVRVADKVRVAIEEFKPKVPLLLGLKQVGMRQRHWEAISGSVGFTVEEPQCF